jgi:6-phosphogluconolactonase/glucosamine-6-phosphate isomerase/deaminase
MSGNEDEIKEAQAKSPEATPVQIALATGASVHEVYQILDEQDDSEQ